MFRYEVIWINTLNIVLNVYILGKSKHLIGIAKWWHKCVTIEAKYCCINGDTHVYGVYGFALKRGIKFCELLGHPDPVILSAPWFRYTLRGDTVSAQDCPTSPTRGRRQQRCNLMVVHHNLMVVVVVRLREPPEPCVEGVWGTTRGGRGRDLSSLISNLLQICFSSQDECFKCCPVYFIPKFLVS